MAKIIFEGEGELRSPMLMGKTPNEWVSLILSGNLVEVVRCKDCRKCHTYTDVITGTKQYRCYLWKAYRDVDADFFCSSGERWMDNG